MLSSLPVLTLLIIHFTSLAQASPIPQNPPGTNAPAGPPITSAADLTATLGDLVIPQKETSSNLAPANDTISTPQPDTSSNPTQASDSVSTPPINQNQVRSPPMGLSRLVEDIGDFRLPSNVTAGHVVQAAK